MKYDFDQVTDRRNSNSLKWDVAENELPMWVADMDFQTAPEIRDALEKRVAHGVFGYNIVPDEWYEAYCGWWRKNHHFEPDREWLMFSTGVVPTISSVVRKLTTPGENILIQTPVYNIFFNSIRNNGRNVLECPLHYENYRYSIDFCQLEERLADPQTTMMILCNPHNPVGKIWDRETLREIGELCCRHHVVVLSDEIHCDLTAPGLAYVPFVSASDTCRQISITCLAPTKAFNLAGLQTSAVMVPDPVLRHKVWRGINTDEVAEPNSFAVEAAVAAFGRGKPWLDALREYLQKNKCMVADFFQRELPGFHVISTDATYLLWIDCGELGDKAGEFAAFLRRETGLYLAGGEEYGEEGKGFVRWNVACPKTVLADGLERFRLGAERFKSGGQMR